MFAPPPELVVHETPHWLVNQCADAALPGYLIVGARDPEATRLAQLSPEARSELGPLLARVDEALEAVLAPKRVYVSRWGHTPGHSVHFHVIPVFDWIVDAMAADERYRVLTSFHASGGSSAEDAFDGPDLSLYVVREFLESTNPPPIGGPSLAETVHSLRKYMNRLRA